MEEENLEIVDRETLNSEIVDRETLNSPAATFYSVRAVFRNFDGGKKRAATLNLRWYSTKIACATDFPCAPPPHEFLKSKEICWSLLVGEEQAS